MITAEVAAEYARRSHAAAARNKIARAEQARQERIAALNAAPDAAAARKQQVERVLDLMLDDMLQAEDGQSRARIASSMDKVWNLLYPRAGALKPKGMGRTGARPVPMATQTPVPVQYMTTTVPN